MRRNFLKSCIVLLLLCEAEFADADSLFNVSLTGNNLSITTTPPNHSYSSAGIKINTPGYSIAENGGCTPISNGYCLFPVSNINPANISLVGASGNLNFTVCLNGEGAVSCQEITFQNCAAGDVAFEGQCYYLDGSNGVCDAGYAKGPQSILAVIGPLFAGKNYRHQISDNCCIDNSDPVENYGMTDHCNTNGPFTAADVALGGAFCNGANIHEPQQLTLCARAF